MSKQKPNRSQDNRAHAGGGVPAHPDDEELARRTEAERVDAGLEDYDPDEVPPATGAPRRSSAEQKRARREGSEQYTEERAEVEREVAKGDLDPDQLRSRRDRPSYPPSRYDD